MIDWHFHFILILTDIRCHIVWLSNTGKMFMYTFLIVGLVKQFEIKVNYSIAPNIEHNGKILCYCYKKLNLYFNETN